MQKLFPLMLISFILITAGCISQQPSGNFEYPATIDSDQYKNLVEDSQNMQSPQNSEILTPIINEVPESSEVSPPVLKNLGINIEPWDKQTNRAGDLIFTRDLLFDDGRVSNDRPFVEFGYSDGLRELPWIEYWFHVPLGTEVRAPADGTVTVDFFDHTQDWGVNIRQGNEWTVSFEHLVNVAVEDGQYITAGEIIGEAAPRNTFGDKIAMTELAVWKGGRDGIVKYCPFSYLDDSLKPVYEEKINQLVGDWEDFLNKDIYNQEDWVEPGCLLESIIESEGS